MNAPSSSAVNGIALSVPSGEEGDASCYLCLVTPQNTSRLTALSRPHRFSSYHFVPDRQVRIFDQSWESPTGEDVGYLHKLAWSSSQQKVEQQLVDQVMLGEVM